MADLLAPPGVMLPGVQTLARPSPGPLLAARSVIQRSDTLRAVFVQAKQENWSAEQIAQKTQAELATHIDTTEEEQYQVALYLADEYLQFGDTLLLISRETGKAVARITEKDLWQPPDLPRESGSMVKQGPQVRPEILAFLYQHGHEQAREAKLKTDLAVRTRQTAFLAQEGDRRLWAATREGRRNIELEIQQQGERIFEGVTGPVREFLRYMELSTTGETEKPAIGELVLSSLCVARTCLQVADAMSFNHHVDFAQLRRMNLVNQWVRDIAMTIGIEAHRRHPPRTISCKNLTAEDLAGVEFWVCDPESFKRLRELAPQASFLVLLQRARTVGFTRAPVGSIIQHKNTLTIEGRELFDRWDTMGTFHFDLHLDFSHVVTLNVETPNEGVAEVVQR